MCIIYDALINQVHVPAKHEGDWSKAWRTGKAYKQLRGTCLDLKKIEGFVHTKLGQVQCSHTITRYHGCKASSGETLQCAAETLPVQASWLAQSSRQQWFWVYYRHATATSHAPRPLKRNWRHPEQVLVLSSRGNQLCSSCNSKVVRFLADTDLKWHLYIWRCLDSWNCAGFHDELEVCMTTRSEKCWLRIPMRVRAIQWQHLFVNGLNLLSLLSAWIVSLKKKCNDLVLWKMQVPMMAPLHLNLKLPQLMPRSQRNNQRKRSPHLGLKFDLVAWPIARLGFQIPFICKKKWFNFGFTGKQGIIQCGTCDM